MNNFVFEPDEDIIKVLNKETNAHKAMDENKKLIKKIQDLANHSSKLQDDLYWYQYIEYWV